MFCFGLVKSRNAWVGLMSAVFLAFLTAAGPDRVVVIEDWRTDAKTPVTTTVKSQKTGTVTFVVMRSGSEDLGKWLTERRNVAEDYAKIFGEFPDDPSAITISIDSNDTHPIAESFMGPIVFRPQ